MPAAHNSDAIMNGWFSEICPMWPGMALSVQVDEHLFSSRSRFQQIDVYRTRSQGNMLVLDGIIQLTEADEFAYHEMLVHPALFAHPCPEQVLVIGGGDGGVLRELGRHPCVASMDFCEIDQEVIQVARNFFPGTACGFDDSRIHVHIGDGSEYVSRHKNRYDVIIVDSSDPVGPGGALFEQMFYQRLKAALKPGGIVVSQGESFFMHPEYVKHLTQVTRSIFPVQGYSHVLVPSYPGGHLGVCLCSLGRDFRTLARPVSEDLQESLRYYTPEIHGASFVLPRFAARMIDKIPFGGGCDH